MEVNDRLKKIIFKKLANDLSHVEVIPYKGSIWFIDRDKKYWYLELEKDGNLQWRYQFFDTFFQIFSLQQPEYEPLIKEWAEKVLNRKVKSISMSSNTFRKWVEDVLNSK